MRPSSHQTETSSSPSRMRAFFTSNCKWAPPYRFEYATGVETNRVPRMPPARPYRSFLSRPLVPAVFNARETKTGSIRRRYSALA